MAPSEDVQYQLGMLTARVASLEATNEQLLATLEDMRRDMAAVRNTLAEAKGGVRTLLWVGSIGAALGGMIGFAINTWLRLGGR